jgi:DNA-binding GntR family transcriptional regulator
MQGKRLTEQAVPQRRRRIVPGGGYSRKTGNRIRSIPEIARPSLSARAGATGRETMVQAAAKTMRVRPDGKPGSSKAARKITPAEAMAVPRLPRADGRSAARAGGRKPGRVSIDDATIYDSVYTAIVDHVILPGTKLPEDVLARAFGVSRTRIRKVLLALAHENLNLVTLQHNRGASVSKPSEQEAREVFAARRVVEAGIIADLARRIAPEQVAELRRFVAREHTAEKERDRRSMIRLSGEFHLELARLMRNEPLIVFLRALISRTSLIVAVYEMPGNAMCSHDEHGKLLDRLAAHDVAGAVRYMEEHLQRLEDGLDLQAGQRRPVDLQDVFARMAGSLKAR